MNKKIKLLTIIAIIAIFALATDIGTWGKEMVSNNMESYIENLFSTSDSNESESSNWND